MSTTREWSRLARQCLLPGFLGPEPPPWLRDGLSDGIGGVVLFAHNLAGADLRALTDRLRAAAGRDLVIALDEEGGDVTRLDHAGGSRFPGNAALGALDDPATTEEVYAAIGTLLVEAGVTLNLAPVADVNSEPRNPVIGTRSFGSAPQVVARQVAAAVKGLQRNGIAACAKHFPGHGNSVTDSHYDVAVLHQDLDELLATDIPPFRAAVRAGVKAVMTGHLRVPAVDAQRLTTVSPAVTRLLREDLGFTGTIVTDALEMRALSATMGMAEGFVQALIAGADTIETGAGEYPDLVEQIPAAVVAAIRAGRLAEERLREAAARTAQLARPGAAAAYDHDLVATAARRCLERVGDPDATGAALIVQCRTPNGTATGDLPWSFAERLAARVPGARVVTVDGPQDVAGAVADLARTTGKVVLAVRDPDRFPWQHDILAAAQQRPELVLVDLGWPAELPAGRPVLRTRGISPALLTAAAHTMTTVRQTGAP